MPSDDPTLPSDDPVVPTGDLELPSGEPLLLSCDPLLPTGDACWFPSVDESLPWSASSGDGESRLPASASGSGCVRGALLTEAGSVRETIEEPDSSGRTSATSATPIINPADNGVRLSEARAGSDS